MKNFFNFINPKKHKIMKTNQNTKGWSAKNEDSQKQAVKPGVTKVHNLIIVDESGSMRAIYHAALNGMNETLKTIQQAATDCPDQAQEVTLVTFDTQHYKTHFNSAPAAKTHLLTNRDYIPGGCTPLYDAMGKALTELEPKVKENEVALVTVITDGLENASCEFTLADIRALVDRLDKAGWVFSYIGANQDAAQVGHEMGIEATLQFEATEEDMNIMWENERMARTNFFNESRDMKFDAKTYDRKKFFKK